MYTQLREYAQSRDIDRLEESWMETLGGGDLEPSNLEALLEVAESVLASGGAAHTTGTLRRLGTMLELLCACVSDETPARITLRLFRMLLRLYPENRTYRSVYCQSYERVYPIAAPERAFYEVTGVADSTDVLGALERLDSLLRYREGAYVYHKSGWGVGKILGVDPYLKQVRVDLEEKPDHRIAIDAVDSILEYLEPDSFRVLFYEGGGELRRLRDEEPVLLVTKVLDSFGNPLEVKGIKAHLVPRVIEAKDWTRWWNRTKALLRGTGYFRVADRSPHLVEKLDTAISYPEELVREYGKANWADARKIAKQVVRRSGSELKDAWKQIEPHLVELTEGRDPTVAIDAATILERGAPGVQGHLERVLAHLEFSVLIEALQRLPGPEAQRRGIDALVEARPEDWQKVACALIRGRSDVLRNAALGLLEANAPQVALDEVGALLRAPHSSPEAICYLFQAFVGGVERVCLEPLRQKSDRELLVILFDLIDHLTHRSVRVDKVVFKDLLAKMHVILGSSEGQFFRQGIAGLGAAELRTLHDRIVTQERFTPDLKAGLLEILSERAPELVEEMVADPWEENCVYTTAEGLERRKEEFRQIMEEKLPKNFEEIGRAASFGDLSENAEYSSALEKRDQLTRQATAMKDELDRVRIIDDDMVPDGHVGLGSRLEVVDTVTGETNVYSVLGPWDGTPEDGVLSYTSPIARSLYGKKAGEEVEIELPKGVLHLRIVKVASHFSP